MIVANYPLSSNGNNTITNIDSSKDLNITASFPGNFTKGYFSGNTASISLNRPYVDNYTNKFTGMPWEIDFDLYIPNCRKNKTIITISNPSTNIYKNKNIIITTNTGTTNLNEICIPTSIITGGFMSCKIQCTGAGGDLSFFANGKQYGNTIRGFILTSDLGTNKSVITFTNNSITIYLSKISIYMDSLTENIRNNSNYDMSIGFKVRKYLMTNTPLLVDIPYPYTQFTEMEFIITDSSGNLIPSYYYKKIYDNNGKCRFYFPGSSVTKLNINDAEELRFTFVHNRGKYAINKMEYNVISKANTYEYKLPSSFNKLMDLNMRYRVYYDRKLIFGDTSYEYSIDRYTGTLIFNSDNFKIESGKDITVVVFYTGTKYNTAIPTLPMSGYVYFKKHEIDRNYNKDLCCFFLNGKLVDRNNIIQMSNNVYKISKDLKSRYNIEAFNMSPRIPDLIPFYKKPGRQNTIPKQYIYKEFEVMFFVPRNDATETPHRRQFLDPLTVNILTIPPNVLPNHKEWYITLLQHGLSEGEFYGERSISYTIKFFKDDYSTKPQDISILGQIRLQGNFEEYVPNSPTALLLGKVPSKLTTCINDTVICSVQAKTIYDADTYNHNKDIDGVLVRLEIDPTYIKENYTVANPLDTARRYDGKWVDLDWNLNSSGTRDRHILPKIYYEMEVDDYEKDNYVNIFEWVVSSEANGKGLIYYRKTINMFPDNNPYENR